MVHIPSRIYLASQSPRRRELLRQIGVSFQPLLFRTPPRDDEDVSEAVLPGETAEDYVVRVAEAKASGGMARVAMRHLRLMPVLGADTTLDLGGEIIGKPGDEADAADILSRLSGRTHRVLTAIALASDGMGVVSALSISQVRFANLSDDDIRHYIASGEPFGKAGAYGIQGKAAQFIEAIEGSYTGIVGLPLYETARLLREVGVAV